MNLYHNGRVPPTPMYKLNTRQTLVLGRCDVFSWRTVNKFKKPAILHLNIQSLTASKISVLHHLALQFQALVILLSGNPFHLGREFSYSELLPSWVFLTQEARPGYLSPWVTEMVLLQPISFYIEYWVDLHWCWWLRDSQCLQIPSDKNASVRASSTSAPLSLFWWLYCQHWKEMQNSLIRNGSEHRLFTL